MDMIDRLNKQMEAAEARYEEHTAQRRERAANLEALGDGGDWRAVDDPERIANRIDRLGAKGVVDDLLSAPVAPPSAAERPKAAADAVLERLLGANDLLNSQFLLRGAAVSRSVGRIVIRSASGRTVGYGTGSMVSPQLLLTNNHVLAAATDAAHSLVQFNYVETLSGRPATPVVFALEPQRFFQTDDQLDFTLVAVQERNMQGFLARAQGWNHLIPESGKSIVGERVNIIQHPGGKPQQVALRQNQITDLLDDFLHYSADTERGSSGGPVLNDQWELSALHHAGVPRRDADGRILLTSGEPWDRSAHTVDQIDWIANEGARISRIVATLRRRLDKAGRAQRALFVEAFIPMPDPATDGGATPESSAAPAWTGVDFPGRPQIDESGAAVWTVPLRIRVDLGELAREGGPAAPPPAPAPDGGDQEAPALDRARDGQERTYYEAEADGDARSAYYAAIDPEQSGASLFQALHELVRDSHTELLSYAEARLEHLYPWVDLREGPAGGRELQSIYSGIGFDPEEIIRQELAIQARLEAQARELMMRETHLDVAMLRERLDTLEAQAPFNCEHVVPQSWFGAQLPMRSDLHHLFTCEWGCNSFRSNIPYFQFAPGAEAIRDACGRREGDRFEPQAGKGAVARATLYFLVRYPGLVGNEPDELQPERLAILLQWHEEETVGLYERHRNAAIAAVQGNRNPFIDFPEWARKVDFAAGFGG